MSRWDAADDLKTDADINAHFNICVEEDPGDGSLIRRALGDVARARGMTQSAATLQRCNAATMPAIGQMA